MAPRLVSGRLVPSPPGLHPPGPLGVQAGGRHRSHLGVRVLSEVLPADVGHDPRGQRIPQHVNHGAEAVPGGGERWALVRGAGRAQCPAQQPLRAPAAREEPTASQFPSPLKPTPPSGMLRRVDAGPASWRVTGRCTGPVLRRAQAWFHGLLSPS